MVHFGGALMLDPMARAGERNLLREVRPPVPAAACVDQNATQLMHLPDRCFPALLTDPRFVEAMLIPFHDQGKPVGTVWIVANSPERKFDR